MGGTTYTSTRVARGRLIGAGCSGIVELVEPKKITKSAWTGHEAELCQREIKNEAEIYQSLGPHARLVDFHGYDPATNSITLAYMPKGTLREYLQTNTEEITHTQRLRWSYQSAEALGILHAADIFHCDFSPRNLLLDDGLNLKLIDFGSASRNGRRTAAGNATRFRPPGCTGPMLTPAEDLFALGSTIYEISLGRAPYEDLSSERVKLLYRLHQMPALDGIKLSNAIRACWLGEVHSVQQVIELIQIHI